MDTYLCAHCGSTNLQHRCDDVQCLACGNLTDFATGKAKPVEPVFVGENPHLRRPQ